MKVLNSVEEKSLCSMLFLSKYSIIFEIIQKLHVFAKVIYLYLLEVVQPQMNALS